MNDTTATCSGEALSKTHLAHTRFSQEVVIIIAVKRRYEVKGRAVIRIRYTRWGMVWTRYRSKQTRFRLERACVRPQTRSRPKSHQVNPIEAT